MVFQRRQLAIQHTATLLTSKRHEVSLKPSLFFKTSG